MLPWVRKSRLGIFRSSGRGLEPGGAEHLQRKTGGLHMAHLHPSAGDLAAVQYLKAEDPLIPGQALLQVGHADGKVVDAVDLD